VRKKAFIDARWTLKVPLAPRFYFIFSCGSDKRRLSPKDLEEERRNAASPLVQAFFYSALLAWVLVAALIVFLLTLYLIKSYAGIDLFADASPLPNFLKQIGLCH
jgi:multisubunit Na+/H+ antiporter MnhC subunit